MQMALDQARAAWQMSEVPIGCVIVRDGEVLGVGHNKVERYGVTRHAEIVAIEAAIAHTGEKVLPGTTLYVTVEPCTMCIGAILLARIDVVVYGAAEPKTGACGSVYDMHDHPKQQHRVVVRSGVLAQECASLIQAFFAEARTGEVGHNVAATPPFTERRNTTTGTLHVVPTPIGNIEDITARALKVLRAADVLLCEDTRHTGQLLQRYGGIHARLVSNHEHNEAERAETVLRFLADGKNVAMVSDAGMPAISDPGYRTIVACIQAGVNVEVLPGPSAFVTALVGSGLSAERVLFVGFPPQKKGRGHWLHDVLDGGRATVVMYESPYRVEALLADVAAIVGSQRRVCIARELSKVHEEYLRGTVADVAQAIAARGGLKGECVVIIDAAHVE